MKKIIISLLFLFVTNSGYAGEGGYLNIINQSTYTIVKVSESMAGLSVWSLPNRLQAGVQQSSYVEYNGNPIRSYFELDLRDKGVTTYSITCPNNSVDQIIISAGMIKESGNSNTPKIYYEYYIDNVKSNCVMASFAPTTPFAAGQSRSFLFDGTVNLYILNK